MYKGKMMHPIHIFIVCILSFVHKGCAFSDNRAQICF